MKVMVGAGAQRTQAHAAITALSKVHDPRRLMPGQEITLIFDLGADGKPRLVDVSLDASADRAVVARLGEDGGFRAEAVEKPLERIAQAAAGIIQDSLFLAAKRAGLPAPVTIELIRLYSFDVDFQRDIQPGDHFQVLYEAWRDDSGAVVKFGEILYAELSVNRTALPLYRFRFDDGSSDYFNAKGESVRKALMKTPVDGARLSSRYGKRRHPILGYSRMHRGVDFAAPRGTPIMAAGDGIIEAAGRNGAYGKYIRIRHNSEYKTAYAHLTKFAKGTRRGRRVTQGKIIGYVGSTGRSTGPHLHYEIHRSGRQINPLGLKLPTGRKLRGQELVAFQARRQEIDARWAATPPLQSVAD